MNQSAVIRWGWSLCHPLCPATEKDLNQQLEDIGCAVCDAQKGLVALGNVYNRGLLIYFEAVKHCTCGFKNRIFVVINDIKKQDTPLIVASQDALDRAKRRGLLPNPAWDEGFMALRRALHLEDTRAAIPLAEALATLDPNNANGWYNLGLTYSAVGRWFEALAAFDQTLGLDPEYPGVMLERGKMLSRLGEWDAARPAFADHSQKQPEQAVDEVLFSVLGEQPSPQGLVRVTADPDFLHLHLGGQCQGSLFAQPLASRYYPQVPGPGPWSPCFQINAFLALAASTPTGRFLMFGLGLGAGAVGLLHLFPGATVDIVEHDQAVVDLAFSHLPLLAMFRDSGRLRVFVEPAASWQPDHGNTYELAHVDLYSGQNETLVSVELLTTLRPFCKHLCMNLICMPGDPRHAAAITQSGLAMWPLVYWAASLGSPARKKTVANWFASTAVCQPTLLLDILATLPTSEATTAVKGQMLLLEQNDPQ